ncbi:GNAT family N-acetyltransferase [Desertivirga brevis]|uniref:GNAT family N-acetyltransferase n=1 Tax=Desertivirga brevis TaxID=2810310 RepID=UPI001A97AE88|nr:GNAT family N-acetyltransferase [Pedobacter sp. SYSU D00873]
MEIQQVSLETWEQISNGTIAPSIQYKAEFVTIISESFNLRPVAWIVMKNGKAVLGFQTFSKDAKLIQPSIYIYTSIWTNGNFLICQQALLKLLELLKSKYNSMHFIFSPSFTDVRPFIRLGFKASVNYTILKNLDELEFHGKLKARETRARKEGIKFFWGDESQDVLEQYRRDFTRYGFSKKYAQGLELLIKRMIKAGYAKALTARLGEELIASGILIVDDLRKHSMNILISSEKKHYDTGVHTALYMEIFRQLKKDGYETNDLFGANTLGIGNFKSNFSEDLTAHYEVKYNFFRSSLSKQFNSMSRILKRFVT